MDKYVGPVNMKFHLDVEKKTKNGLRTVRVIEEKTLSGEEFMTYLKSIEAKKEMIRRNHILHQQKVTMDYQARMDLKNARYK